MWVPKVVPETLTAPVASTVELGTVPVEQLVDHPAIVVDGVEVTPVIVEQPDGVVPVTINVALELSVPLSDSVVALQQLMPTRNSFAILANDEDHVL